MSLINEMLKDLEDRKVKSAYDQKEILTGVQASHSGQGTSTRNLVLIGIVFIIVAALIFYAMSYLRVAPQPLSEQQALLEVKGQATETTQTVSQKEVATRKPEVIGISRQGNDIFLIELSGRAVSTNLQQTPGKAVLSITGVSLSATQLPKGWTVMSQDGNTVLSIPVSKKQQATLSDSGNLENQVIQLSLIARPQAVVKQKPKPVQQAPVAKDTSTEQEVEVTAPAELLPVIKKVVPLTAVQKSEAAYRRANAALETGDLSAAGDALRESIGFKPQAKSYIALAGLHMKRDENASARQVLRQGQKVLPDDVDIALLYSRLLMDVQQYDAAFAAMTSAISGAEGRSDYQVQYAAIAQQLKRNDVAIDAYVKALTINPGQPNAWMGLGMSLEAEGKRSEALQAYYHALAKGLNDSLQPYVMQRIQILEGEGS
jgi:MSHA biogenesis protein MshN